MITYLLGKSSTGKFRFAVVESDGEWHDNGYIIQRSYGQVGGKTTLSPPIIISRTKQNRTWKEQLQLQYNSEVKKFKDKGYVEVTKHPNNYTSEELNNIFGEVKTNQFGVIKPQLAKQADKITNRKIFDREWLISRKLDGLKALFFYKDGEIHTASRGGNHYDYSTVHLRTNPKLIAFFEHNPTVILDGELFKRGVSLQQISGAARMEKDANTEWLEYWVYDCYVTDNTQLSAKDRFNMLRQEFRKYDIPEYPDSLEGDIKLLEHETVSGWDNMKKLHDEWVADGFEGAVITDPVKSYNPGSRSNNLIKIKQYLDDTYKVISYELGLRGSEDMVFICEMKDGRTFKAMPIGSREVKEEYVQNFEDKYKGHLGDCKYFTLSDDGIPTQPKFLYWRWDLE